MRTRMLTVVLLLLLAHASHLSREEARTHTMTNEKYVCCTSSTHATWTRTTNPLRRGVGSFHRHRRALLGAGHNKVGPMDDGQLQSHGTRRHRGTRVMWSDKLHLPAHLWTPELGLIFGPSLMKFWIIITTSSITKILQTIWLVKQST